MISLTTWLHGSMISDGELNRIYKTKSGQYWRDSGYWPKAEGQNMYTDHPKILA